jgi:hypothetical protein
MMAEEIRRGLLRLALRQAALRWRHAFWRWLALMALLWGGLSLAAVLGDLPRLVYYGLLLTALGALPALLAYPPEGESLVALVRGIDKDAALESYLCQQRGPARALLLSRAGLALRLALLDPPPRPALSKAWPAVLAFGIALFALAQGLSLRAGYGISLGYPEKGLLDEPQRAEEAGAAAELRPEFFLLPPDYGPEEAGSAGARPAGGNNADGGEAPMRSSLRRPANEAAEPKGADMPEGDETAGGSAEDSAGGGTGTESGAESGGTAEGPRPTGSARQFGYEGSGRALEPSPLLDYRAVLEREFVSRTGKESALGPNATPARFQESIAAYYRSFARDLILRSQAESRVEELKAAWLRLNGEGGAP